MVVARFVCQAGAGFTVNSVLVEEFAAFCPLIIKHQGSGESLLGPTCRVYLAMGRVSKDRMKKFPYIVASLALPWASLSWAKEPTLAARAVPIYNVVDLVVQKCDEPASIQWDVHPQRAEIQRYGLLSLDDLGYRVNFMQIPDFREWTAAVRLHDRSREVDDSYVLFTVTGRPFDAAYVVTHLPESMKDGESTIQAVMKMQQAQAGAGKASFIRTNTPFGQGVEMIVSGRVGSACFPTSPFKYAKSAQTASIGISRFVVKDGDLIEYALVLPWPEKMSQADAIERAQSKMDQFQRGLETTVRDNSKNVQP